MAKQKARRASSRRPVRRSEYGHQTRDVGSARQDVLADAPRGPGLVQSMIGRINGVIACIASTDQELGKEFDRLLGSIPETGSDGKLSAWDAGNDLSVLVMQVTVLENAAERLSSTTQRIKAL